MYSLYAPQNLNPRGQYRDFHFGRMCRDLVPNDAVIPYSNTLHIRLLDTRPTCTTCQLLPFIRRTMLGAIHAQAGIHGTLTYIGCLRLCLEDDVCHHRMEAPRYLEVIRRNTAQIVNDRTLRYDYHLAFSSPSPCINVWSVDVDRRLSDYAPPFRGRARVLTSS
jgi:hypothetical protein